MQITVIMIFTDLTICCICLPPLVAAQVVPYNFTALGAFDDRDLGALIVQDSGTVVNFWVDVMADPCPNIIWFFNGIELGPSNDTFNYDNPCSDPPQGSSPNWRYTLTVMLTDETSGSYNATFTNIAGKVALPTPAYFTIPGTWILCVVFLLSLSLCLSFSSLPHLPLSLCSFFLSLPPSLSLSLSLSLFLSSSFSLPLFLSLLVHLGVVLHKFSLPLYASNEAVYGTASIHHQA